jgi:hypothetical protein
MVQVHRARVWRITPASVSWGNSIHPVSTSPTAMSCEQLLPLLPCVLCLVALGSSLPTRVSTCIASVALARTGACATSLSTSPIRRPPFFRRRHRRRVSPTKSTRPFHSHGTDAAFVCRDCCKGQLRPERSTFCNVHVETGTKPRSRPSWLRRLKQPLPTSQTRVTSDPARELLEPQSLKQHLGFAQRPSYLTRPAGRMGIWRRRPGPRVQHSAHARLSEKSWT